MTSQPVEVLSEEAIAILASTIAQVTGEDPKAYIARTLSRAVLSDFALHVGTGAELASA